MEADTFTTSFVVFEDKTSKNQRDSPLLRLPAELRNKVYDLVCSNTQVRVKRPRLGTLARHHRGALALLSTCRQIRHEASSTFHTMAVFEVSTFVLDQLKKSSFVFNSERWNSIQSIQMRSHEVESWCCFADIHPGNPLGIVGGGHPYIGYFPSLKHVLVVYSSDENEDSWGFSHQEIDDTLTLAFGKENLCIHIQNNF